MMSYKEYKDAYEMLEAFGFDHAKEYTRFNKNGSWESMYFNPNGAQGEGQIVVANGTCHEALDAFDGPLSGIETRGKDSLCDFGEFMESALRIFEKHRDKYIAYRTDDELEASLAIANELYDEKDSLSEATVFVLAQEIASKFAHVPFIALNTIDKYHVLSPDPQKRITAALDGLGLDKLIDDEDYNVRIAVASKGYHPEEMINDPEPYVRAEVASCDFGLDKLSLDECVCPVVEAVERCLDKQGITLEEWIAQNPDKCVLDVNKPAQGEDRYSFDYRLLDRLKTDCDYILGEGGPGAVKYLHQGTIEDQIAKMRELYDAIPDNAKPEWLTPADIDRYEHELEPIRLDKSYPHLADHLKAQDGEHGHKSVSDMKDALVASGMSAPEVEVELSSMNKTFRDQEETTRHVQESGGLTLPKQQFVFDEQKNHARFAAGETDQAQRSQRAQSVDELAARGREKADAHNKNLKNNDRPNLGKRSR